MRNCAKCIIFKKAKNIEEDRGAESTPSERGNAPFEASIKEDDEDEIEDDCNNDSNASEQDNDNDTIEQQVWVGDPTKTPAGCFVPTIPNKFSNGEMMCGSVIIDDSSNNNKISIKQYISMINEGMNTLLNQSKLYTDATEIDSSDTITDNLKIIYEKVDKLNKSIKPNDDSNEKVISLLKIIDHKIDDNSHRLNDLKNALI